MTDRASTGPATSDPDQVEADLRAEVEQLARIAEEQGRTIASLRRRLSDLEGALGLRLERRVEPLRRRALATPVVRHLYRVVHRGAELWADEGASAVFRQVGYKLGLAVRGRDVRVSARGRVPASPEEQYALWLRGRGRPPDAAAMGAILVELHEQPLISVLVVMDRPSRDRLAHVLSTLTAQVYERWEVCLAISAASRASMAPALADAVSSEPRLKISISRDDTPTFADAWREAAGEFVAFLEPNDRLAPHAMLELVARLASERNADVLYSDEDDILDDGGRADPLFKPDWSPDLLLSMNYLQRFGIVRRTTADRAGGLRSDLPHGQVYDLMLRVAEASPRIVHVPQVLCHRGRPAATADAALARRAANRDESRAIEEALARRGCPGRATAIFTMNGRRAYTTRLDLRDRPMVSIIIPTRDNQPLLETTIESIRARTSYDRYEILVIDNDSADEAARRYLNALPPPCRLLRWPGEFNYSGVNNLGARHASGTQLLFLNNDVEVIEPDWMTALLEQAERPEVGAVGGRLLYADGRIQHAGVVVGINRSAGNAFRSQPGEPIGSPRLADLVRNCSAVTGACMMVPRRVFDEVGGFDENLRLVLNDVDLCLRIREKGYLVVYTPHARLYHYEGSSRGLSHPARDQKRFEQRWSAVLDRGDPYYNPNLTITRDDWTINN